MGANSQWPKLGLLLDFKQVILLNNIFMLQDPVQSQKNYDRFIEQARQTREVWGLKSPDGWAYCPSRDHGEDNDVLVFWSDRASAVAQAKEDWISHVPTAIPLETFISRWLQGMEEDGALVGPNWDADLFGLEVEPLDLEKSLTVV